MGEHWFWWLLTLACILWYSVVVLYVSIKGVTDIRTMLAHLSGTGEPAEEIDRAL